MLPVEPMGVKLLEPQAVTQLERWFQRGEYGRVIYTCDRLLAAGQPGGQKAHILFWKGNAHLRSGRAWHGEAISSFREGLAAAGRDRPIKARLIASLGRLYTMAGDVSAYQNLIGEFERIARDRHPQVQALSTYVWFNWGVVLDNAFRYGEAEQAYARAAECALQSTNTELQGSALHNLGGVRLAMGRLAEASAAMAEAEPLLGMDENGHKILSRRAQYFLACDDLTSAQQAITDALVHPSVDDFTRADLYLTWGQTLVALGRPQEAEEKALAALDYAVKAVHYQAIHKINRFLQGDHRPAGD